MNMIEKVARAICAVQFPTTDPDVLVEWIAPFTGPKGSRVVQQMHQFNAWTLFIVDAHAAIRAMREPTEAMKKFGEEEVEYDQEGNLLRAWQAMIDAVER